jgi:NADH dehydrogenase
VLGRCEILNGRITAVDHAGRIATFQPLEGGEERLLYDVLVMAPGSVARTIPIPGLAELGISFRTVAEAIYLRNHVLARLDVAASTDDAEVRRRALAFVFVGGGYAGVEAMAELEDMARSAMTTSYPNLRPSDMRWVLVEMADRILPEVSRDLAEYTVGELRNRGVEVALSTKLESVENGHIVLSNGEEFDAETVVWTAGVRPNPVCEQTDLPTDDKHRIVCRATLEVDGVPGAWSAGDCAAVPDLTKADSGATTGPSAQHAVRQAKVLGTNIVSSLRGEPLQDYRHAYAGSVASLGLHKGVAEIYGVKLRGWPAWLMHRTYHMTRMPTFNRKVRVVADWTLALFFHREVISFGGYVDPKGDFRAAATAKPNR